MIRDALIREVTYRVEERLAQGEHGVELGRASCMSQLPGTISHFCFWPLHCSRNRTTESFQMEAGPPYDKQRIQMGLRSGNTVLIYFRSGVGHCQSVLIALAADLHTNKPWQGQHKFWKYVSPIGLVI